jgi:hypothetical protein
MIGHLNIEFAHFEFTGATGPGDESVRRSSLIASAAIQRCIATGMTYSTCVLIDDKHVRRSLEYSDIVPLLRSISRVGPDVDYICFESRLSLYKYALFDLIKAEQRTKIREDYERYERRHGRLACSQDIAIWHMMRLGCIMNIDVQTLVPVGALHAVREGVQTPFVASELLSILHERDREPERRCETEILSYLQEPGLLGRINREFYATAEVEE